jgi:hypothetical protein
MCIVQRRDRKPIQRRSGWDSERGKGAIDLDGGADSTYGVKMSGTGKSKSFVLECTGGNDGEEGPITDYRLESVSLGLDEDGNETTAPVAVLFKVTPAGLTATIDGGSNLRGESATAFESLRDVLDGDGGEASPPGPPGFPDGVLTVTRDAWRNRFYADVLAKEPNIDNEARRKRVPAYVREAVRCRPRSRHWRKDLAAVAAGQRDNGTCPGTFETCPGPS